MKSITVAQQTPVGCKKTTYEVEDAVYDYVISVLEGDVAVPCETVTEDEQPAEATF